MEKERILTRFEDNEDNKETQHLCFFYSLTNPIFHFDRNYNDSFPSYRSSQNKEKWIYKKIIMIIRVIVDFIFCRLLCRNLQPQYYYLLTSRGFTNMIMLCSEKSFSPFDSRYKMIFKRKTSIKKFQLKTRD